MFVNSAGDEEPVESVQLNTEPADKRYEGLMGWICKLLGNSSELSFDQISDQLRALLPKDAYPREVFARYFIWADYTTDKLYRQDYSIGSDGSLALSADIAEVIREVEYKTVSNHEKDDTVKEKILAALNAAGISVTGMDDVQTLAAYSALQVKPAQDALIAANSKLAGIELAANAAADAELTGLATTLAVNSSLTVADLKQLGIARLKELGAAGIAAPVVVANTGTKPASEFAGYSLNAANKGAK